MQIDLFTLAAQIVNFLVLLALLRYFLYGRIIEAMDAREERIASRLEEAEEKRQSAQEEKEEVREQRLRWEEQHVRRIREAREEVETKRKGWLDEARQEVESARSRWLQDLQEQRDQFFSELRHRIGEESLALARHALAELASADLEEEVIDAFLARVDDLDEGQRERLASAERWTLRSAFELSEEQERRLVDGVSKQVGGDRATQLETSKDLVAGIEIRLDGLTIGWSLARYLDQLEERVQASLQELSESGGEESAPSKREQGQDETDDHQPAERDRPSSAEREEGKRDGE